ncbi:MAG: hypothetical protein DMD86_04090 [Candidatus Rokuibacteriota bacterium]|nr:MAG: hypothetical protein DMD86_04090 [Candidatus Rokubacteria bacterium]
MRPARTLIVNADDFGLTGGVSRGILEAHRTGIVTSTTVIVNRPIDPVLLEALRASGLGVGLHLNLTLGPPVSDPKRVPSLVDAEGKFIRDAREVAARASKDEARIELGTQIDVFRRLLGRFPTHLELRTPDHFVGESGPEPYWTAERVLQQLASLPGGVSEFMTHPGHYDEDLAYSRYGTQRDIELRGLTDPRARELIEREGIRLAHFGDL